MLDPDILAPDDAGRRLDDRRITAAMPAVIEAAQNLYEDSVPDLRDEICPGAAELLAELAASAA